MNWFDVYVEFVKTHEGLRLVAYDDLHPNKELKEGDPVEGTLTIGWGHTKGVVVGQTITEDEAERLLAEDTNDAVEAVERYVTVPLNPYEKAALVSLVFNIGAGNFRKSTLLKKLNAGDRIGAAGEFAKWRKSKGKVLRGLIRRRELERELFLRQLTTGPEVPNSGTTDEGEEGATSKSLGESKTILSSLIGLLGAGLTNVDWRVGISIVVTAFAFIAYNRYVEWKKGEH